MGVWYIMMSISMYMSCVFQWFLVFSDLWQPRSGPGFFSSVFCTPVCLVCLTWAAVSSCAHKHPWDFLHERSPSEIAWHECRQKFWGFAQPSLKGLHLSAGATQHQSCLYARRCVACAHQIAGDLSCWIRLCCGWHCGADNQRKKLLLDSKVRHHCKAKTCTQCGLS